ncbi:MAG: permease [Rhodobacteraceae bacterium]|nr:permease [Paracoccaceae bacterium]
MADATRAAGGGWRARIAALKSPWAAILAILLAVALLDPGSLAATVAFAAHALAATAPYILIAVLLLAWLKAAGAEAMVARAFAGRETRMIVMAALIGGLAPFCSCQVIPFIAGLLALGAPLSAVMAFWLSSPLIDPPTLLITAGALGWPFAIAKALAAVGLGLFGGLAVRGLMRGGAFGAPLRRYAHTGCGCGPKLDGKPQWRFWSEAPRRGTFRAELAGNGLFLLKWLALAYVLEALLVRYVPADLIASFVGGSGVLPIVTAAFVGMPAYLNGYVAPPLLAGLVEQGMSLGAAMAFIVAGSVSSIPAMAAVWSLVKPRVFAVYLGLGLAGAVLAGVLFQAVS